MNLILLLNRNIFKVQDEFLEEPEIRELEKIAEDMMTPKHFRKRKREKPPDELKENNMEDEEGDIEKVANDDVTECPHCKKILPKGSLQHHLRTTHSQVSYLHSFISSSSFELTIRCQPI